VRQAEDTGGRGAGVGWGYITKKKLNWKEWAECPGSTSILGRWRSREKSDCVLKGVLLRGAARDKTRVAWDRNRDQKATVLAYVK